MTSVLCRNKIPLYMYITVFFIHSSTSEHMLFLILAIVSNAAVNRGVHRSFEVSVLVFFYSSSLTLLQKVF